jgi:transcriptional regulator with XRE-family HTH domain
MATDRKRIIGLKLRAERLARGLTQEQVAERIARTVETVSNIERGRAFPSLDTLEQMCEAVQIPFERLFEDAAAAPASSRRLELEARLRAVLLTLSDADLQIAVEQVEVLARGRGLTTRL